MQSIQSLSLSSLAGGMCPCVAMPQICPPVVAAMTLNFVAVEGLEVRMVDALPEHLRLARLASVSCPDVLTLDGEATRGRDYTYVRRPQDRRYLGGSASLLESLGKCQLPFLWSGQSNCSL